MTNDKTCPTGNCPPMDEKLAENLVRLSEGSGGTEMNALIKAMREYFPKDSPWRGADEDAAVTQFTGENLVFTTDAYVVTPLFFPGGNIGDLAFCGTVNDLSMMGATPLGLSLSLVLEEGLPKKELFDIMKTIGTLSREYNIPIVTGDTKVVERGAVDKMIITTSGVGSVDVPLTQMLSVGDKIIVSGGIGEHGTTLLSKRFELESDLVTDSAPLHREIATVKDRIKQAKDVTRGGLAAILNEFSTKAGLQIAIDEDHVPMKREVRALTEVLGIDVYSLACEGRFVCVATAKNASSVLADLQKYNESAAIIGEIIEGNGVRIQTQFGGRMLSMPSGNIVPRIC